ncbi:MAG: superoxide dismutase family protein [Polymorphobacter sp.]
MRIALPLQLPLLMLTLFAACADKGVTSMGRTRGAAPSLIITSELVNAAGSPVGTARLTQEAEGVRVIASFTSLPPGEFAVHLHAVGRCDAPGFTTAGGHFNPAMKQHGHLNPAGEHAGDLPNVIVSDDRKGTLDAARSGLRLVDGNAPLVDADGAAIVVHAGPDDYRTDPAGNAGARIACGVLSHGKTAN